MTMSKETCPNCNIELVYRKGIYYTHTNDTQYLTNAYICKNCGYRILECVYEKKPEVVELDVDNLKKRMEDYIKSI